MRSLARRSLLVALLAAACSGGPAGGGNGDGAAERPDAPGGAGRGGGGGNPGPPGDGGEGAPEAAAPAEAVVHPAPYDGAFKNALMGFRPDLGSSHRYATLFHHYIGWSSIEGSEADGVDKIRAFCDAAWKDLPARNGKVIPRVYLEWPGRGTYWPADLTTGDYSSDAFRKRLVRLIDRLGQVWDGDSRVAFVQTGLIGRWGEQHSPRPTAELQALMGDAYSRSFKRTLLENRYPDAFAAYGWGIYWDSFGCDQNSAMKGLGTRWARVPYEGEIAYDSCKPAGATPTEDVSIPANTAKIVGLVRDFHTTGLGWIASAPYNASTAAGIDALQIAFGYRLVMDEARWPSRVEPGGDLPLALTLRNLGSAPFYYAWVIELALLRPGTREVVWKGPLAGMDLRGVLPGDGWDAGTGLYGKAPVAQTLRASVTLPAGLVPGVYVLSVAILDPGGSLPGARFAIRSYYRGGRHPLGSVGVGAMPASIELDPATFDDLQSDDTLRYSAK